MALRKYPTIGCCGIDCGLCPRFYTEGTSRCPGCGSEGFESVHPPCGYITCCEKRGLNVCAECADFPCKRFEKETGEHDSFVLHRKLMPNQRLIAQIGIDEFIRQQRERISFLEIALEHYNDGRSKNLYCIAATLLSIEDLEKALTFAENGESLKAVLNRFADEEGQELKLRK